MPHVPLLRPAHASPEVADLYADFARRMQFPEPPNFILTQGHSAAVVRGTWGLVQSVLVGGEIPRWTKEMIFVAISQDRNCRYCSAAHVACCRMLGVHPDLLEKLIRNIDNHSDPKLRDTLTFARKCARDPQSLTAADYKTLSSHGYTQSQVVEVVSMSALAVYANIIADAMAIDNDEIFDRL